MVFFSFLFFVITFICRPSPLERKSKQSIKSSIRTKHDIIKVERFKQERFQRENPARVFEKLKADTSQFLFDIQEFVNSGKDNVISKTCFSTKWAAFTAGLLREARGEYVPAQTSLEKCIELCASDPNDSMELEMDALHILGRCLVTDEGSNSYKAVQYLKRAAFLETIGDINNHPKEGLSHLELASLHSQYG